MGHQLGRRIKCAFFPQPLQKKQADPLAVDVSSEIQEMTFDSCQGVLINGRPHANIGNGRENPFERWNMNSRYIDAAIRLKLVFNLDVKSRKSEGPPEPLAFQNSPIYENRPREKTSSLLNPAVAY